MPEAAPVLYIRLRKRIRLPSQIPITLSRVAQILVEPEYERRLKEMVVHVPRKQEGNLILIDMIRIISIVKKEIPDIRIEHFGPPHAIVEMKPERERKPNFIAVALVWLLLFFGAGLAIMNFHADVSMMEVQRNVYRLITGHDKEHPYLFQIPYSIGIGIGMVIFFNHLFRKKFNEEPSPLEVEMFLYQENLDQYVVADEYRKMSAEKEESP